MDAVETTSEPAATRPTLHVAICVAIGAAAAVLGLLPWLLTGARLPLQNLWATETLPGDMPIALLPFSQYAVTLLLGMLVLGSAVAGVAARALRARLPRRGVLAIAAGALAVQAIAAVQSTVVVEAGLADGSASTVYLVAVLAVVAVGILLGLLVLRLIARASVPWAAVGLGLAALAAGLWVSGLVAPLPASPWSVNWAFPSLQRWVAPVLMGAAIAWAGVATAGRAAAAAANLVLLWIAPATFTAVSAAAGSRVLLPRPAEMLDYALGVFQAALLQPELVLPQLLAAVLVAGLGIGLRMLLRRRSGTTTPELTPQAQGSTPEG